MFRKLNRTKKGQNTAEYALLIALVVAAIIAMQTYAQRTLQARIRDASQYLVGQTTGLGGNTTQYEPYYLQSDYGVSRNSTESTIFTPQTTGYAENSNRIRELGGFQVSLYNGINAE